MYVWALWDVEMKNENLVSESVPPTQPRPEMKGPHNTDIDNILSGLNKTKPVHIHHDKKDYDYEDSDSVASSTS